MARSAINPDYTFIPDDTEVWVAFKSDVTDIMAIIPASPDVVPDAPWNYMGVVDEGDGIPLKPSSDVKKYNAFGHRNFRVKVKNGELETSFKALEILRPAVQKLSTQGSAPNRIGVPRNVQCYVMYRYVDDDLTNGNILWVTVTPAPVQFTSTGGFKEGEKNWYEFTVPHTTDSNGDVFEVVDASTDTSDDVVKTFTIAAGVTGYTATVSGSTTPSITTKTKAALQAALRALPSVAALVSPGATVDGPDGGPLVATFTGPVTGVSATGTGGTVTVA